MSERKVTRLFRKGAYLAEVEVTLIETDHEWSPYYALNDVRRMETVQEALEAGDLATVARLARLYKTTPMDSAEGAAAG